MYDVRREARKRNDVVVASRRAFRGWIQLRIVYLVGAVCSWRLA